MNGFEALEAALGGGGAIGGGGGALQLRNVVRTEHDISLEVYV